MNDRRLMGSVIGALNVGKWFGAEADNVLRCQTELWRLLSLGSETKPAPRLSAFWQSNRYGNRRANRPRAPLDQSRDQLFRLTVADQLASLAAKK